MRITLSIITQIQRIIKYKYTQNKVFFCTCIQYKCTFR